MKSEHTGAEIRQLEGRVAILPIERSGEPLESGERRNRDNGDKRPFFGGNSPDVKM